MRDEIEAPPPAEHGAILTPPPKDGAAAKMGDEPNSEDDPASSFIESVRKVFAPCVGVVDAASFLMGNCRFGKDSFDNNGDGIATRLKNGAMHHTSTQKRQGETLEIPSNGGFDDDVSAISAHTLEEMERLRQAQRRSKLQMLTPPNSNSRKNKTPRGSRTSGEINKATLGAFTNKQLWSMTRPTPMGQHNEEDSSIGVSTSGSSSAEEEQPPRIPTRGNPRNGRAVNRGPRITQRSA